MDVELPSGKSRKCSYSIGTTEKVMTGRNDEPAANIEIGKIPSGNCYAQEQQWIFCCRL
jgi:hypothetical protein